MDIDYAIADFLLYLETNGEKYEIGLCFSTGDGITKRIVQDLVLMDI